MKFRKVKDMLVYDGMSNISFGFYFDENKSGRAYFRIAVLQKDLTYLVAFPELDNLGKLNSGEYCLRTSLTEGVLTWFKSGKYVFDFDEKVTIADMSVDDLLVTTINTIPEDFLPEKGLYIKGFFNEKGDKKINMETKILETKMVEVLDTFSNRIKTLSSLRDKKYAEVAKRDSAGMIIFNQTKELGAIEDNIEEEINRFKKSFK